MPKSRQVLIRNVRIGLSIVLLAVSVVVFLNGRSTKKAGAGEIFRETADQPGTDTFTPSIAAPPPAESAAATATPPPSSGGLVQANADVPGLYGGVRDVPSCNANALIQYLQNDPAKGRAWADAIQIDPADVKTFIETLTPVLLRTDTRVTEFKLAGNKAVASQAILQSGTAVLLDRSAFPRVRCAAGNPLAEPRAVTSSPRYTGPTWPGFSPNTTVVIVPARQPVALVIIDIRTGGIFVRIPGTIIIIDIERPPVGVLIIIVEPGGPFTVTGTRFPAGAAITITFDNPAVTLANVTADGGGNFNVRVNAPATAAPGPHTVTITGGGVTLRQPVYVIPRAPVRGPRL